MRFGAAYYREYQPSTPLDTDLRLMREAGFSVIRVGESVWSTWEPRDGEFDLDWLEPVLDGAADAGIGVILGTPTYAVPPWLQVAHPEIAAETSTGVRVPWGGRQEMDQSHPVYRRYAERVIREVIGRYRDHPAVIGYQVDNEPGLLLPHNEHVFERFRSRLRAEYGDVEALNRAWGLAYWSHRLADWTELWRPDGNTVPAYDLAWRRFQSTLATELIAWQTELVRGLARAEQFVTTCISYSRPQVDDVALAEPLDIASGNAYYLMQDGLTHGVELPSAESWWESGVAALFQWADRAWATKQGPFLVTETNAQSIGISHDNRPPYRGQLRQAALALVSRGARAVEYWHWHTLHSGFETYWGGVLPHSQRPGRVYREVAALGDLLQRLSPALEGLVPDADAIMIHSVESRWAMEFAPPLADAGRPDRGSYERIASATFAGLHDAGVQARVLSPGQLLGIDPADLARRTPVLVAAGVYIADDALLDHLLAYARAGGHLLVGIRTGYADELGRARQQLAPPVLAEPAGASYDEYSTLIAPLAVEGTAGMALRPGSAGERWVDALLLDGAEVVARFGPTELEADAALTTRAVGLGRISVLATLPNAAFAASIGEWLVPDTAKLAWRAPAQVSVSTATATAGRLAFVTNWSGAPAHVVAPRAVINLDTGRAHAAGDPILLGPRDVAVFQDAARSPERADPSHEGPA